MAGYMTKLQGYVYEGELVNGASAAVENGILMVQGTSTDAGKLKLIGSADTTTKLLCKEVTTIYDGVTAYRFVVNKLNANYYFVENGFDINDNAAYDKRTYTTPVGAELRAHPLLVGEEFVTDKVTGTIAAGTEYGVKTDGTIG
jgi:hypothetical protein